MHKHINVIREHVRLSENSLGQLAGISESAASLIVRGRRNPHSPGGRRLQRALLAQYRKKHPGELPARVGSRQLPGTLQSIAARIAIDNAVGIIAE